MAKAVTIAQVRAALEKHGWKAKGMLFEKDSSKDAEALIAGFDNTLEYRTNDPNARLPKEIEDIIRRLNAIKPAVTPH